MKKFLFLFLVFGLMCGESHAILQTVNALDLRTSRPAVSADIAVYDGCRVYTGRTNSQGSVKFNCYRGLRAIAAKKYGYFPQFQTVDSCAAVFTVKLRRFPTSRKNTVVLSVKLDGDAVLNLLKRWGVIKKLGSCRLKDISQFLDAVGAVSTSACIVFPFLSGSAAPEPCKFAAIVDVLAAGVWLAKILGVSPEKKFSVWRIRWLPGISGTYLVTPF